MSLTPWLGSKRRAAFNNAIPPFLNQVFYQIREAICSLDRTGPYTNQKNIAESDSFQAENNQTLTLNITSDIKGGSVDLILFAPHGKEQRITISSTDTTKEITLEKGTWQYNCSGIFKDGGNVRIVGTIK